MNENLPSAEIQLYVTEALSEAARQFANLTNEKHKDFEKRLRVLEDKGSSQAGARAVWMLVAVAGGGVISALLGVVAKIIFK